MHALSLFAGAGGSCLGLKRAGLDVVASIEWNADAFASLQANGLVALQADLFGFDYSRFCHDGIDLIEGGPPCQPFSVAGSHRGVFDPRDGIPAFHRALEELRPHTFIMENVRGLTFKKHQPYLAETVERFERLGYSVEWRLLNAADYGVPQTRVRLFIVGSLDGMPKWPEPTHAGRWITMAKALGWTEPGDSWPYRMPATTIAGDPRITARCHHDEGSQGKAPKTTVHVRDGNYEGTEPIKLTLTEAAALQGFPAEWRFVGNASSSYRQIGNACPPALSSAVASAQLPRSCSRR